MLRLMFLTSAAVAMVLAASEVDPIRVHNPRGRPAGGILNGKPCKVVVFRVALECLAKRLLHVVSCGKT